jgi:putative ABC transport system permease protein
MLQNYLKIAFRSLWQVKVHSVINILGLGLGIACTLLILLYVHDEWTFDQFHAKANRIYRANTHEDWGENQQFFNTNTPFPLGPTLKENFPEVEKEVRILPFKAQVKFSDHQFSEPIIVAGQDFFDVFDFDLQSGTKNALHEMTGAVISRDIALKYFGTENPINKTIAIQVGEKFEEYSIQAVAQKIPANSSIRFDILISDLNLPKLLNQQVLTSGWFNVSPETYILLRDGTSVDQLLKKFPALLKTVIGEDYAKSNYTVGLQPLTKIHLDPSYPVAVAPVSNPKYSYILGGIAVLILVVACINFITLSIGRSLQRAREVGVRKVAGARRSQLIFQFIGEAVLVTLMAILAGFVLAFLTLPLFNDLAGKNLILKPDGFLIMVVIALVALIGIIAGSYPAFVLSAFRPIAVLKGKLQSGTGKQGVRKVLVAVQLVLSLFLITSTIFMRQQLNYLQNRDLGFNKEQLIVVPLHVPGRGDLVGRVKSGFGITDQFKAELAHFPDITGTCGASHDFGNGGWTKIGYSDDQGTYRNMYINVVDEDYIPVLNMHLKSGRNFTSATDGQHAILVNEAFLRSYNWSDAIGKRIPGKKFADHEIVGVVKDFNYASLYNRVEPLVIVMNPGIPLSGAFNIDINNSPIPKLMVRLRPGNMAVALDEVKNAWKKICPDEEFTFTFSDETIAAQYRNDQNLGKIVTLAMVLAVLIGSSGLYGLATLAMQSRTREISIRKVLGATERGLLWLLSGDYLLLILISLGLSAPITLYAITRWLQTFEYRIELGALPFLLAGSLSLLIAILTIGYQALKTAWSQPAETLKYE